MKITRLVFIFVLLASVLFIPQKTTSAFQAEPAGTIDIVTYGTPTFADGQLTYHFRVTYSAVASATAPYDARVAVLFEHPQVIDSFTVVNAGGQHVEFNAATGLIGIPHVTMTVGSSPYVFEFDVTFKPIDEVGTLPGSLPIGSLPLTTSATATIANTDGTVGSLPVSDEVEFTLGESEVMVTLTASPATVKVGGTVTYTVFVNTTDYTVLDVNARVTVRFATADLAAGVIGTLGTTSTGVVIDNVNKTVTWEGELAPAGSLPATFTFTVQAGALPTGSLNNQVFSSYVATATASVEDVAIPGSLPPAADSESFTIQALQLYLPVVYDTLP